MDDVYLKEKVKLLKCKNMSTKEEFQLMQCYLYLLENAKVNKNDKRLVENIKQMEKYIFNI